MEAPQLRQLSEQERRTNILQQELGRPTVVYGVTSAGGRGLILYLLQVY